MNPLTIAGLGTALPAHSMSQEEALKLAQDVCCTTEKQRRLAEVLYRRSGVKHRYTSVPHRNAVVWKLGESPEMEGMAIGGALEGGVLESGVLESGVLESGVLESGVLESGDHDSSAAVGIAKGLGLTTQERMQLYHEHAVPLAIAASREALVDANLEASQVTHLVTVSCTGFGAPGVDVNLISALELPNTTQRVNVGFMGCHGAINGIRVAQGFTSDPNARVLLCAVELCSLHFRFDWDPERFIGNALFGDGAASLVCLGGEQPDAAPRVIATGSCLIPDSMDAMSWTVGDHGFEMTLSARVPGLIEYHLRPWLAAWLEEMSTSLDEIDHWVVHPGGPRIISAVEEALGLTAADTCQSRTVLEQYGNLSSPTILFIVDRLKQQGAKGKCLVLGFGPGLEAEAALLEL